MASPSCFSASAAVVAGGEPETLALLTASGPVSLSRSSATGCSGMRTATVPFVSPRSQARLRLDRNTSVSPPGQNSSIRSLADALMSSTSANAARLLPTSTGGGTCLPRPLAASSAVTAAGVKASAATPYTVSVGSTTSSPLPSAVAATVIPAERSVTTVQSNRALMPAILPSPAPHSRQSAHPRGRGGRGNVRAGPPLAPKRVHVCTGCHNHDILLYSLWQPVHMPS